jgi:sigma-B regulation protein RsbU (phosphoserine phosphatase)
MTHETPKPASSDPARPFAFKALYRKLEGALAEIERSQNVSETLERILEAVVAGFRDELGVEGGRVYRREEDDYVLCCGFGASRSIPAGVRVPPHYPPHLRTLDEGLLIMRRGEPGYDEAFERSVGVDSTFAAITVGKDNRYVVAFSIVGVVQEERLLYSLTAVRHVINLKLEHQEFTGMLEQAREIQESMLPGEPPDFPGYEIAGRTRPAESVSGDLYDYLPVSKRVFGVAIVDASGHGVPAALMARDAITGLRTLAAESLAPSATIERLNRVVHRAALASKFVSLFYARLTPDGGMTYCNAGQNPPLLLRANKVRELMSGGPVLGPIPTARYQEAEQYMDAGDFLVMYTDGIVERANPNGEPFGTERLLAIARANAGASAENIAEAIFAATDAHAAGVAQRDDMTVVVVRRR